MQPKHLQTEGSRDVKFYPDALEAVQGEAVALLHHMLLLGGHHGGMEDRRRRRWWLRALAAAVRYQGDPLPAHHLRGDVVVVHVE